MKQVASVLILMVVFVACTSHRGLVFLAEQDYNKVKRNFIEIDLGDAANRSFADPDKAEGPIGKIIDGERTRGFIDLAAFKPESMEHYIGVPFQFNSSEKQAIVIGKGNTVCFPKSADLKIGKKANGVYLLHTSNISSRSAAKYSFHYSDGSVFVKMIKRNEGIFDWNGIHNSEESRTVWSSFYPAMDDSVTLQLFAMANPYPEKKIDYLQFEVMGDEHQILIAGVTLVIGTVCLPELAVEQCDLSNWFPQYQVSSNVTKGTVLDVSYLLDAPAGKHGKLTVNGSKFFFEDGTPARFWGGNIYGAGCFPEHEEAIELAERIAQNGANIVRLHHLDVMKPWSDKTVERSLFGGQNPKTTRKLDPVMLDNFQFLFSELKKRGVYVFLSHTSSRSIAVGDDFPGPKDALDDVEDGFKLEGFFDSYLIDLQKEFLTNLLGAKNPYTGLTLAEDPAMVFIEINNENSLSYLGKEGKFSVKSPYFQNELLTYFNIWLAKKYSSTIELSKSWSTDSNSGLLKWENLEAKNITIPFMNEATKTDQVLTSARMEDTYHFLYDLQADYYRQMNNLFNQLGVKALVVGSNHWTAQLSDILLNAEQDFLDRHIYWAHPSREYNYMKGQIINSSAMVKSPFGGSIGGLAMRRVFGKPFTVSEWHNCLPNPYRAEGPVLMAAYSCFQDWHPMQYAYSDGNMAELPDMINSFDVLYDPAHTNLYPAAALLFQRHDVQEATIGYYENIPNSAVFDPNYEINFLPELALSGKYGLKFEALNPSNVESGLRPQSSVTNQERTHFVSVTGEIEWDTQKGKVTIDTDRSQAFIGFNDGRKYQLSDVGFDIQTEFAVIVVNSLTNQAIAESNHLLVSTSAGARWTDTEFSSDGDRILETGRAPFMVQPVEGTISIKSKKPIIVYPINNEGKRLLQIPVQKVHGEYNFSIKGEYRAMHYEVVAE